MSLSLNGISLKLPEYELAVSAEFAAPITGLFGPSGAGKTTLMEIIAGLRRPQSGTVHLQERCLTDAARKYHLAPEKRRIGYVPQDLALFPHLNAEENLRYAVRKPVREQPQQKSAITMESVIALLELTPLLTRRVHQLSGGEKQRTALGRALLAAPEMLLLDEPLSSLDERLKQRIMPYLKAVHVEFGVPILYVTHSRDELASLCDEVWHMSEGRLER